MTEPTTRLGKFLWRLSGHEVDITPRNELEECLDAIASGSGSGGGGTFVIGVSEETSDNKTILTFDKTAQEISTAMAEGKIAFADRVGNGLGKFTERFYVIGTDFPPGGGPIVYCVAAENLFNDSGVQVVQFRENLEGYPSMTINTGKM